VALHLHDLHFGFPRRPDFLGPVSLSVQPGDTWAIIGPNGAGKSTLLRLMAGLLPPNSGAIEWSGTSLAKLSPRTRAQTIAFLPQRSPTDFDLTVREVVLMGRFPHRSLGLFESANDQRIADEAMQTTAVSPLADRLLSTLSGGEAQRVHLAAALAQKPKLLLLDEPTASLDLEHQLSIFELLRRIARERGVAVVVVTHDVNLAARYCDHVLLLDDGRVAAVGSPREVITPAVLEPVYRVGLAAVPLSGGDGDWIVPRAKSMASTI
jgi:iron complex transport system ATP-binding protein